MDDGVELAILLAILASLPVSSPVRGMVVMVSPWGLFTPSSTTLLVMVRARSPPIVDSYRVRTSLAPFSVRVDQAGLSESSV